MKLTISDVNFFIEKDWLFKLTTDDGEVVYIMILLFYKEHKIKNPISKKHLDYYDKGLIIDAHVQKFDEKYVVISIIE